MEERREQVGGDIDATVYPWGVWEGSAISIDKSWQFRDDKCIYRPSRIAIEHVGMRPSADFAAHAAALSRALEIAAELDALHPEGSEYTP